MEKLVNAIGGYFELELPQRCGLYHTEAIALNTARNALEFILSQSEYKKLYMPYFTCDVMLEPTRKLGTTVCFYSIDENLEPIFDFDEFEKDDAFLYTNYFGLKNRYVESLSKLAINLIVDNAQAFYTRPFNGESTIYSARKFFGVSDGAYLYTKFLSNMDYPRDSSFERMSHLLVRRDCQAEDGYSDFLNNENSLNNSEIKLISNITSAVLETLDYQSIAKKRISNFNFLHSALKDSNKFSLELTEGCVPLVYPFWTESVELRQHLILNRIYCPTYWPNVKTWCNPRSLEYRLADQVIYLPVDQRYGRADLARILDFV
jgi:hypothetical protein